MKFRLASVAADPVIVSPLTARGTAGSSLNALGLPAGLTLNASSGLISGILRRRPIKRHEMPSRPIYTLPVQNGDYTVVLKFAEIQ